MILVDCSSQQLNLAFKLFERLKRRDGQTGEHSLHVACITKIIMENYIYTGMSSTDGFIAGLLHDIGKMGMPDFIFQDYKIERARDLDVVKKHPVYSRHILINSGFSKEVVEAVYMHHERADGKGYPQGLAADRITREARLLAIVDSFSAITEDRAYRKGKDVRSAINILVKDKDEYDMEYLAIFIKEVNNIILKAEVEMERIKVEILKAS